MDYIEPSEVLMAAHRVGFVWTHATTQANISEMPEVNNNTHAHVSRCQLRPHSSYAECTVCLCSPLLLYIIYMYMNIRVRQSHDPACLVRGATERKL